MAYSALSYTLFSLFHTFKKRFTFVTSSPTFPILVFHFAFYLSQICPQFLLFYQVYLHSTLSKIAFMPLDCLGDDNQNQVFAAGLKNCVFYRETFHENLRSLSRQPGVGSEKMQEF